MNSLPASTVKWVQQALPISFLKLYGETNMVQSQKVDISPVCHSCPDFHLDKLQQESRVSREACPRPDRGAGRMTKRDFLPR